MISLCTSRTSLCHSTSRPFLNLCIMWLLDLLCRISSTLFIASMVLFHRSRRYLTGTFLLFSNSNAGSIANSLPAVFRYALVHLVLRGFFFFLKAAWHFERQNLKIWTTQGLMTQLREIVHQYQYFRIFIFYLAVVSDELDPMSRIYPGRAEITSFYTHFCVICFRVYTCMCLYVKKEGFKIWQSNRMGEWQW